MENIKYINRENEIKEYMDSLKKLDPSKIVFEELFENDLFKESLSDEDREQIYDHRNSFKWNKFITLQDTLDWDDLYQVEDSLEFISTINKLVHYLGYKFKSIKEESDDYNSWNGYKSKSKLKCVKMDENEEIKKDLTDLPLDEVLFNDFVIKHNINNRIIRALDLSNVKTLQDIIDCQNLGYIRNLGDLSISILSNELENYGYKIESFSNPIYRKDARRFVKIDEMDINDDISDTPIEINEKQIEKMENDIDDMEHSIEDLESSIELKKKQKAALVKLNKLDLLLIKKTETQNKLQEEINDLSKKRKKMELLLKELGYDFD